MARRNRYNELIRNFEKKYPLDSSILQQVAEEFENIIYDYSTEWMEYLLVSDIKALQNSLNDTKNIRRFINQVTMDTEEIHLYNMGIFKGIYDTMREIAKERVLTEELLERVISISPFDLVKSILKYIYNHTMTGRQELKEILEIPDERELRRILHELVDAKVLIVYRLSEENFYNLTEQGFRYVQMELIEEDTVVDDLNQNWKKGTTIATSPDVLKEFVQAKEFGQVEKNVQNLEEVPKIPQYTIPYTKKVKERYQSCKSDEMFQQQSSIQFVNNKSLKKGIYKIKDK